MEQQAFLGLWKLMIPLPKKWLMPQITKRANQTTEQQVRFMTDDYHQVRDFVVQELHRIGKPLTPAYIAEQLDVPPQSLDAVLDALEKGKVYLYRSDGENVTWAYPVTVDDTPHHLSYSTGEKGNAA